MTSQFNYPLMKNNFERSDFYQVKKILNSKDPILTQSFYTKKFEKEWSKWLGVKYSVFVNSGSSANLISVNVLKILKKKGDIIVPTLTWSSDISSVIHCNFNPIFVDVNPKNLSMCEEDIFRAYNKNVIAIFITHVQGFNGLSERLLKFIKEKKIFLIEDVCESHGAMFKNKKLGTFGDISNFSFYYAHHMSTIEGGMISTNNKKIYEICRTLRSHGMSREIEDTKLRNKISKTHKDLSPKFIFIYSGFNMRNTEIGALIGLNQLKKLDKNISLRNKNLKIFLKNINPNIYKTNFDLKGCSNYAFPLVLNKASFKLRNNIEKIMKLNKIEFRRGNAGGGNQLRQPYLKNYIKKLNLKRFKEVEHIHFFGYYLGNYPGLKLNKILQLCNILNSVKSV
jgi:CDP-6-deoxy-D-xylo-4-hexulose-3-dehydrase